MITLEAERKSGVLNEEAFKHCQGRLRELETIQSRLNLVLPLLEKLM